MTPDTTADRTEPAVNLWKHIFGDERGRLAISYSSGGSTLPTRYFSYPGAAPSAAQWALEKSAEGRDVYFCAHLLIAPRRIKENATSIRTLWFEMDGGELPNGQLKPSAVVESSPGRYHGYLRLTDSIPPEIAEQLNQRLAHEIGADPSGYDLSQLLRVPETVNHKYPEHPVVRVLEIEEERTYSPAELEEILPELEEPEADHEPEADDEEEPPIVLDAEAMKVCAGRGRSRKRTEAAR